MQYIINIIYKIIYIQSQLVPTDTDVGNPLSACQVKIKNIFEESKERLKRRAVGFQSCLYYLCKIYKSYWLEARERKEVSKDWY